MVIVNGKKKFEVGDVLRLGRKTYTFARIIAQEYYPEINEDVPEYINIEFIDENGNYHHYKNEFDGGEIIPKGKN